MLRRITLLLALLVSMIVMLPLAASTAHNLRSQFGTASHRFRHHSRSWWRRHRALMRRRQALIARRRALVAAARNGVAPTSLTKASDNHAVVPTTLAFPEGFYREGNVAMPLPNGWSASSNGNGTSNFRIAPPSGMPEAHATLAVVAVAATNANKAFGPEQRNMLGGVSYTDLRRNVIDKMISAGGWVVNDRQREIGGQSVFEVIAQTPATNGKPEQVWNFYFTQVNGRIYSLTTNTAGGFNGRLASDAEKFLGTLHPMEAKAR